jgi:hypothetical protein
MDKPFFKHDWFARHDGSVQVLIDHFDHKSRDGAAAYGIWNVILEQLYEKTGNILQVSAKTYKEIAAPIRAKEELVEAVIKFCLTPECNLLQKVKNSREPTFYNTRVLEATREIEAARRLRSEKSAKAGRARWEKYAASDSPEHAAGMPVDSGEHTTGMPADSGEHANGMPVDSPKMPRGEKRIQSREDKRRKNIPPTFEEVKKYCLERKNKVPIQRFMDFYDSKGWMIGKNKMKDWGAAVRTWEQREPEINSTHKIPSGITL